MIVLVIPFMFFYLIGHHRWTTISLPLLKFFFECVSTPLLSRCLNLAFFAFAFTFTRVIHQLILLGIVNQIRRPLLLLASRISSDMLPTLTKRVVRNNFRLASCIACASIDSTYSAL
ncbi:hypothetical protein WT83_28970 [Burkholderia territorii]|uniref:Uncharacterized protein n=1 Tax=Burkholderia territorii TaxID=1503055 RepID=A0A125K3V1_9BURK|nr:hypothetical protein WT83_28970 [Burkholderia territorii]